MRRPILLTALAVAGALAVSLSVAGCGVKIAIPHAEGLFAVNPWVIEDSYDLPGVRQVAGLRDNSTLFVITADSLQRRMATNFFSITHGTGGLSDATALCVDPRQEFVLVWEQGSHSLSWYKADDLTRLGTAVLPAVGAVRAMAADTTSIGVLPGAEAFVYLSDPEAQVVHRYGFDAINGVFSYGILTNSIGEGTRSTHDAWGLAVDGEAKLLVCDADTLRNWVIRFDGTPDFTDVSTTVGEDDPLRGMAVPFAVTCEPPAMTDYVLGNAAECLEDPEAPWVPGPSDQLGKFRSPKAVAVDGSGQVFVADTGNNRIQVFTAEGEYAKTFGGRDLTPSPVSIALFDIGTYHAAYVFVVGQEDGKVRKFVSFDRYVYENGGVPPKPN